MRRLVFVLAIAACGSSDGSPPTGPTVSMDFSRVTDFWSAPFPSADQVGKCIVFYIGGNKYRLIAIIRGWRRVYVRFVVTHKEYDRDSWKKDCEC